MARAVSATWLHDLKVEVRIGGHRLVVDEPTDKGGSDAGPTPTELLLAAVAA